MFGRGWCGLKGWALLKELKWDQTKDTSVKT